MKKQLSIAMGLVLAGMASAPAMAEDNMGLEFSANVAMTTDYVWRGVSQNEEDAAIQGGFDVAHSSGVYAGIWGSNVDAFGSTIETDYYLGWAGDLGPVSVDAGYIWYTYPGQDSGADIDFEELYVGVSKDFEMFSAGLTFSHDPDNDDDYWDISGEVPVGDFAIAAHYGFYEKDDSADDYEDWSIGASTELGGFGFDLTYTDTDIDNDPTADDRVVFTISKSL